MLLWDRPNCGKSDVQFYGQSESHMRAETLHALITGLDIGPCIIAGGSGGARDSMLTTMLLPGDRPKARGVEHRRRRVRLVRPGVLLHRAEHSGGARWRHEGLSPASASGRSASPRTPPTRTAYSRQDPDEFLKLMLRWLNAFVPKPGQTIPGVDDEMFDNIKVPDADHPRRRERPGPPQADVAGGELPDQGLAS